MGFSHDMQATMSASGGNREMWFELIDNQEFLDSQYDVIAGAWPTNMYEAVLVVDEHNEIPDMALYSMGLKDPDEVSGMMGDLAAGEQVDDESREYTYEEILSLEYSLVLPTDLYEKTDFGWADRSQDGEYLRSVAEEAETVRIVGIIRPNGDAVASSASGYIGYTSALSHHVIDAVDGSEIVQAQLASPDTDVFTGIAFEGGEQKTYTLDELTAYAQTLPEEERTAMTSAIDQMRTAGMDDDAIAAMLSQSMAARSTDATYSGNLEKLGVRDQDKPSSIYIYAADFDAKEALTQLISDYNASVSEEYTITYTDMWGCL
jgi:putative ABC transport system permease protein